MIKVDEDDPIGEVELSFPYRDVKIRRGVNPKDFYDLDAEIGRGKFGTVYRCTEKSTGLCLAAKFIGVPKKEDRRNVEREVDIMRQLQHPRLIQLYDAFENGKVMCVVQELIEGGELFERVIDDDFILTEKSCTVFMRQICEGIEFIHKQNILHLDMKPENILCLTKTGNRIKIIDFGLARKFDPTKKLQVLFGTPEFVAPEVVNFDQIGYGTDMWSIGVICYVLLSGLSPFMGHTDVETMANVTIAKYDFDDEAFQEISENAKDFIRKLLLKDMNVRMTSAECLKHAWLQRRVKKQQSNQMDTTKDNLKQFVERWSDHPNSPYLFEVSSHSILPCLSSSLKLSESLNSLVVSNPSPPESLSSSFGSDDNFFVFNNSIQKEYPVPDHFRRASDSYGVVKSPDIVERLNLAEEIRKLSDKLFQLSTISPNLNCSIPSNSSEITTVPWRRQHNKINQSSRDVPISPRKKSSDTFREQFNSRLNVFNSNTSTNNTSTSDNPANTKDVLLKLLDRWEGPKVQKIRHSSISTEYSESESLVGQKTINSLNTFFQTRRTTSNK